MGFLALLGGWVRPALPQLLLFSIPRPVASGSTFNQSLKLGLKVFFINVWKAQSRFSNLSDVDGVNPCLSYPPKLTGEPLQNTKPPAQMPCASRHSQASGIELWFFPLLGPPLCPAPPACVLGRPSQLPAVAEDSLAVTAWAPGLCLLQATVTEQWKEERIGSLYLDS